VASKFPKLFQHNSLRPKFGTSSKTGASMLMLNSGNELQSSTVKTLAKIESVSFFTIRLNHTTIRFSQLLNGESRLQVRVYILPKTFRNIFDIASKSLLKVTSQLSSKRS